MASSKEKLTKEWLHQRKTNKKMADSKESDKTMVQSKIVTTQWFNPHTKWQNNGSITR